MPDKTTSSAVRVWPLSILFIFIIWVVYQTVTFMYKIDKISEKIAYIERENRLLEKQIKDRERELKYLSTPQRIDKEAKMQLGKRQLGEKIIVIVDPLRHPLSTVPTIIPAVNYEQLPNWKKWLWVFLH